MDSTVTHSSRWVISAVSNFIASNSFVVDYGAADPALISAAVVSANSRNKQDINILLVNSKSPERLNEILSSYQGLGFDRNHLHIANNFIESSGSKNKISSLQIPAHIENISLIRAHLNSLDTGFFKLLSLTKIHKTRPAIWISHCNLFSEVKKTPATFDKLKSARYDIFLLDEAQEQIYRAKSSLFTTYLGSNFLANKTANPLTILCIPTERSLYIEAGGVLGKNLHGGSERSMLEMIGGLTARGVLIHGTLPEPCKMKEELNKLGCSTSQIMNHKWLATKDMHSTIQNLYGLIDRVWQTKKLNPHLLLSNTINSPWTAFVAALTNRKHIWRISEYGDKDFHLSFLISKNILRRVVTLLSDGIIFTSNALKKDFLPQYSLTPGFAIYPSTRGLKLENNQPISIEYKLTGSLKLLLLGGIGLPKGQLDAVNAVGNLIKKGYSVELLLIGQHNEQDRCYQSICRKIQDDNLTTIYIHGPVDDAIPFIAQCDVLLMCSLCEASGRVTGEAMYLGKPVIGTNSGGTPEMIVNRATGLLYTSGNIDELEQSIRHFILNPQDIAKMGQQGQSHVKLLLDPNLCIDKYENCISEIMGKRRSVWISLLRAVLVPLLIIVLTASTFQKWCKDKFIKIVRSILRRK